MDHGTHKQGHVTKGANREPFARFIEYEYCQVFLIPRVYVYTGRGGRGGGGRVQRERE